MANDLTSFIPEIWSKKLGILLDKKGVAMQCVNRNYEGEVKKAGDSVHIRSFADVSVKDYSGAIVYENLTSPIQTMTINQKKYFAFKVDDISKAQSDINIMSGYLERSKVGVDIEKDTYIHSLVANAHADNIISTSVIDADNFHSKMVEIKKKLKLANALNDGKMPWVIIDPELEAIAIQAPEFIHATQVGDKTLREGSIGKIAGLDVLVSTNFEAVAGTYNVMAGTNGAIKFASQITEIETIRLQDSFDTAVRGLYVFDAKVIVPKALVKAVYTLT
jgi:hypothetical protein